MSWSGVGTPSSRPKRAMPPLRKSISVGRRASTSCSIDALWPYATSGRAAWSISCLRVGVEGDPLGGGDRLALVDEPGDERAEVGALADAAVREPGERADRVRRGVEDHLSPLRRARVGDRLGGMPPRVQASARGSISAACERARLERPESGVALHVPLHEAGLEQLAGRERRPADHARDVRGERLLVADAVHHRCDRAPLRERVRRRRDRRVGVHRLRRDDSEVAGGQLGRHRSSRAGDP